MNHHLATATSEKYVLGTAVMMESLYFTTKRSHESTFHILYDPEDLSEQSKNMLSELFKNKFNIVFCISNSYLKQKKIIKNSFLKKYEDQGWSFSVLLQAYLSDAIHPRVDKVFYIDSDTVFTQDASEFLDFDLKYPIAAQLDPGVGTQQENPVSPYFNAGVYITYLNYWREHGLENKLNLASLDDTIFHAQDFLNLIFKNQWQPLGPQINVTRERLGLEDFINSSNITNKENFIYNKKPILVHYFGQPKPWTESYRIEIAYNWRSLGKIIWIDNYYFKILENIKLKLESLK